LREFSSDPYAFERLQKRFDGDTLADTFYRVLARRGLNAPVDTGADQAQATKNYHERTHAILEILTHFEDRYEEFQLAEALIEHDEYFSLWRSHHIKMVERMVGAKRGTGGSEGIGYLKTTLDKKFFPELWEARTYLDTKHSSSECPFAGH
jgi:tryptophan 2,3-dioxygenase